MGCGEACCSAAAISAKASIFLMVDTAAGLGDGDVEGVIGEDDDESDEAEAFSAAIRLARSRAVSARGREPKAAGDADGAKDDEATAGESDDERPWVRSAAAPAG